MIPKPTHDWRPNDDIGNAGQVPAAAAAVAAAVQAAYTAVDVLLSNIDALGKDDRVYLSKIKIC
jgi:hypothetical protein